MDIKYSVLISVYFKEEPKFLKLSIDSMINQSLEPDEIVIVKDGVLIKELDELINDYYLNDPKLFTIVSLRENLGLGLALNEGLKNCRNELVARMDSDDISLKDRCQLQIDEFIKDDKLSIVGTMIDEFIDDSTNIVSSRIVPTKHSDILKFVRRRSPFNHPTVMYKKSVVLECGGYANLRRGQDLDLFARMLNSGCMTMNIDKSLLLFRSNINNFKRRKSWGSSKGSIKMIFGFWRKGYSSFPDVIIVTMSQLLIFIFPMWFFKWFSLTFLREIK